MTAFIQQITMGESVSGVIADNGHPRFSDKGLQLDAKENDPAPNPDVDMPIAILRTQSNRIFCRLFHRLPG